MEFEPIICFEVHAELNTRTKLFCGCRNDPDAPPNSNICPVCTGHPGTLPLLNRRAVEFCVRAGLALNCDISPVSRFARKNYFYPDIPKGYQISQFEPPFCVNGFLEIDGDDGRPYPVGIRRIHLEEDAGKLFHSSDAFDEADHSMVDFNRSSVPLIEIVNDHTRNPLRSIREARSYLEKLHTVLRYIGVSDCSMEKGQFRCDVNVSLRLPGSSEFGGRAELKNMASFRFVTAALEYEMRRQAELLRSGSRVPQETRLFDEARGVTMAMRGKEDAPDYRYFTDPDLVEVRIKESEIEEIRKEVPEMPDDRVVRLVKDMGIPREEASVLTRDRAVSDYYDMCSPLCDDPSRLSRWIIKDLFRLLKQSGTHMADCPVSPGSFSRLVNMVIHSEVTEQGARAVLEEMFRSGGTPDMLVKEMGLSSIRDDETLEKTVSEVLDEHSGVAEKIRGGQMEPLNFLVGMVMKKTSGRADAARVREILEKKLLSV